MPAALWASWALQGNRLKQMTNRAYLDHAEAFIAEFLSGHIGGESGAGFSGVAALVGFDSSFAEALTRKSGAGRVSRVDGRLPAEAAKGEGGVVLHLDALSTKVPPCS